MRLTQKDWQAIAACAHSARVNDVNLGDSMSRYYEHVEQWLDENEWED